MRYRPLAYLSAFLTRYRPLAYLSASIAYVARRKAPAAVPQGIADTIGLRFSARHPLPRGVLFDMPSRGTAAKR
jgi:hypothetical protein